MTGPDEISGRKAAGISGRVTVKDKIEYKKVDVTDEIKRSRRSTWRKRIPRLHRQWNRFYRILWNGLRPPKRRQETDRNMKRSASPISRSPAQQDFWKPEIKYAYFAKETQIAVFDQTRRNPRQRMRIRRRPRRIFLRERKHKAVRE